MSGERFKLTGQHLKLLGHANVSWGHMEWGAPAIDGKRPYGNGDIIADMAEILGVPLPDREENEAAWEWLAGKLTALHEETEAALDIVLGCIGTKPELGWYVRGGHGYGRWERVS